MKVAVFCIIAVSFCLFQQSESLGNLLGGLLGGGGGKNGGLLGLGLTDKGGLLGSDGILASLGLGALLNENGEVPVDKVDDAVAQLVKAGIPEDVAKRIVEDKTAEAA